MMTSGLQQNLAPGKSFGNSRGLIACQSLVKAPEPQLEEEKKKAGTSTDVLNKVTASAKISSPIKQREYRRSDGQKRIIPEAVGVPVHQENDYVVVQSQALDFPAYASDQREDNNGMGANDGTTMEGSLKRPFTKGSKGNNIGGENNNCGVKEHSGVTARVAISESLVIVKVLPPGNKEGKIIVEHSQIVKSSVGQAVFCSLLIRAFDKKEGEDGMSVCLEACPVERSVNDMVGMGNAFTTKETEVMCMKGAQTLWFDRMSGKVTALAGNSNFWAVGCEEGCLQVLYMLIVMKILSTLDLSFQGRKLWAYPKMNTICIRSVRHQEPSVQ